MTTNDEGFLSTDINEWIEKHRRECSATFAVAGDLNRVLVKLLRKAEPAKDSKQQLLVALLFARLVEHFQSVIVLAERGAIPSGKALLRVTCDALFALTACAKDTTYFEKLVLDDRIRERQLLHALVSLPREDVAVPLEEMRELERRLAELKTTIKSEKQTELKSFDTAKAAGLLDFYRLFYVPNSNVVHNAVRDLNGHVIEASDGDIQSLRWGPASNNVDDVIGVAVQLAFAAIKGLGMVFPAPEFDQALEELWKRHNEVLASKLELAGVEPPK